MNALWWLIFGILIGWLVELAIDYLYWRRQAKAVAARQALREAELERQAAALDARSAALDARDAELIEQKSVQNAKDAELLAQARRLDERAEETGRLELRLEKRRGELDKAGLALNERDREIAGRHEALKALEADAAERMKALTANEQDVARRVAVVSNREAAMSSWETRILAREREVADREALLARDIAEAEATKAGFATLKSLVGRQYRKTDGSDDLEAIEGVGPQIAGLLHEADIRSFERLSETPVGELTRILEAAGPRFGLADPMTWAEQAGLIVAGDYLGFEALKDTLHGGTRRAATAAAGSPGSGPAERDPAGAGSAGSGPIERGPVEPGQSGTGGNGPVSMADVTFAAGEASTATAAAGPGVEPSVPGGDDRPEAAASGTPSAETAVDAERLQSDGPLFDAADEREAASITGGRDDDPAAR